MSLDNGDPHCGCWPLVLFAAIGWGNTTTKGKLIYWCFHTSLASGEASEFGGWEIDGWEVCGERQYPWSWSSGYRSWGAQGQGGLAKRYCRPRDLSKHPLLVGSRTLEKHVSAKCSGEEWQVGKNVSSRKAYPAIETHSACQRGHFLLCIRYQVPCQGGLSS